MREYKPVPTIISLIIRFAILVLVFIIESSTFPAFSQANIHKGVTVTSASKPVYYTSVTINEQAQSPSSVSVGTSASIGLSGTLNGQDNNHNTIDIITEAWNWSLDSTYQTQYSTDGKTFANPSATQNAPSFSFTPSTSTNPVSLVASSQTTAPATTPGYWRVRVAATDSYTSSNFPNGSKGAVRFVVFSIGAAAADFSIVVTPTSVTIPQGLGGTVTVQLVAINGFSGDVNLNVSKNPPGSMIEFFDPNGPYPPPSTAPSTVDVKLSNGSANVGLTLCLMGTASTGTYNLVVTGQRTGAAGSSHQAALTLVVTNPAPTGGTASSNPPNFPGGIGRRVETTAGIYNGLSATVTLPDPSNTSLVHCSFNGSDDTAYVYSGSDSHTGLDFGYQLGHTGNSGWKTVINIHDGYPCDNTGARVSQIQSYTVSGQISLRFEAPGYLRRPNGSGVDPTLPSKSLIVDATNHVNDGYLIFATPQGEVYWFSKSWTKNTANIKRCNTIAQTISLGKGNGPGNNFQMTGSVVTGGAWTNVLLYSGDGSPSNFVASAGQTATYPGTPYVGWNVSQDASGNYERYYNENNIDMSTIPLPGATVAGTYNNK